jgi:DNA-binding NarL/FixJ family response regulator
MVATRIQKIVANAGSSPLNALTQREQEVAAWIYRGLSNKQIARELTLSTGTVKQHLHNIYGKLQVRNRRELASVLRSLRN